MINNFNFLKNPNQILTVELEQIFVQELKNIENNFCSQFSFSSFPKRLNPDRFLLNLFNHGRVIYFEAIDNNYYFFPLSSSLAFLDQETDYSGITFFPKTQPFVKIPLYKKSIDNKKIGEKRPFVFLQKTQNSLLNNINFDLKNLSHIKLALYNNRYSSLAKEVIFVDKNQINEEEFKIELQKEKMSSTLFLPTSEKLKNDLGIGGRKLDSFQRIISSNAQTLHFELQKYTDLIDEKIGIFSATAQEKSSAQETDSQVFQNYNKIILKLKSIISSINFGFKNLAKNFPEFKNTKIFFSPFLEKKIKEIEELMLVNQEKTKGENDDGINH